MTGGIGSGKSEAAKIFKELSVPLIDLDDISRKITQKDNPGYIGIVKYFGNKYLDKKKNILRKTLKADFFNSKKIKIKNNDLTKHLKVLSLTLFVASVASLLTKAEQQQTAKFNRGKKGARGKQTKHNTKTHL